MTAAAESEKPDKLASYYSIAGYDGDGYYKGGVEERLTASYADLEGADECRKLFGIHSAQWTARFTDVVMLHKPSGAHMHLVKGGKIVAPADRRWLYPQDAERNLTRKFGEPGHDSFGKGKTSFRKQPRQQFRPK